MDTKQEWSRRDFLQTLGSGVPTLALIARQTRAGAAWTDGSGGTPAPEKSTSIDLSRYFNVSPAQFVERDRRKNVSTPVPYQTRMPSSPKKKKKYLKNK